ncbi:DICT sensory domain-containing protein [Nocardioides lijunqiniae]|uniref:DICT sensory domain-containing protein n=1 Tax=Nocardioides lijunqiniae TaxID=2760832 RepID=UPI001878A841|nr:DICT sensory domain-containing protein [Nocardioides lijunqiniae]
MNTLSSPGLTIGALADQTGLSAATLRMWEQRHGFPTPARLASGHRRYAETDVATVRDVVRRRDSGVRLDVAIAQATARALTQAEPPAPSVYAELRRHHPHLASNRLRKSTLLALSWAIEDEFAARATRPHLFGSFQDEATYLPAEERWVELARVAGSAFVLAAFDDVAPRPGPVRVHLPEDAPMRREWTVVCDSPELPAALTAWELPGQSQVRDRDRLFEAVWTVEPLAVRHAARACAQVASAAGVTEAAPVLYELAEDPTDAATDLASVTAMFNRVVTYVDRFGR